MVRGDLNGFQDREKRLICCVLPFYGRYSGEWRLFGVSSRWIVSQVEIMIATCKERKISVPFVAGKNLVVSPTERSFTREKTEQFGYRGMQGHQKKVLVGNIVFLCGIYDWRRSK